MKLWRLNLVALVIAALIPAAIAQDSGKTDESSEDDSAESAALSDVPLNEPVNGLVIPQYSPEGELLSQFKAGSAKRVDEQHIELTDLKIEIHNDDGTTFHVQMPSAVFDLETRILTSNSPTQIRREGFVIDGDAAEFHTKTRFGRMTGNVKMVIESEDVK